MNVFASVLFTVNSSIYIYMHMYIIYIICIYKYIYMYIHISVCAVSIMPGAEVCVTIIYLSFKQSNCHFEYHYQLLCDVDVGTRLLIKATEPERTMGMFCVYNHTCYRPVYKYVVDCSVTSYKRVHYRACACCQIHEQCLLLITAMFHG